MASDNGSTPPLGAEQATPAARRRGVHGIRQRAGLPGDDAAPEREIHDRSPTSYRTARERADTAVEVPTGRRRSDTEGQQIVAQVSTDQIGDWVADALHRRGGQPAPPAAGSGGRGALQWGQLGTLLVIVAMVAAAALQVAGKAEGAEVDVVEERVRAVEQRTERMDLQIRASRREQRMLIRALRPELAEQLEPIEGGAE